MRLGFTSAAPDHEAWVTVADHKGIYYTVFLGHDETRGCHRADSRRAHGSHGKGCFWRQLIPDMTKVRARWV